MEQIARLAAEEAKKADSIGGSVVTLGGASPGGGRKPIGMASLTAAPKEKGPTSLYIFSEDNFIRRYAKMIIEWGYPFPSSLDFYLS